MNDHAVLSPAEIAAKIALDEVFRCIRSAISFRLEAGAGAGKTYSLVKALQLIIKEKGSDLIRDRQQVACITYTNVATDEIIKRTDSHPAIKAATIHSFCWDFCKSFQAALRAEIVSLPKLNEKIIEAGAVGSKRIGYDLGHRRVTDTEILLHHDDVLTLMVALMAHPKFRRVFHAKFPVLFIDEYQDTDKDFAACLITHFVESASGPLVGLFGDSWQKIYPSGAGSIDSQNLQVIGKQANFRSVPFIVSFLNKLRPDLPQQVSNPAALGSARVFHSNSFSGARRTDGHWAGDLPIDDARRYLSALRERLVLDHWDFSPQKTKILMLTHNALAAEQNYSQILDTFEYNDSFIKKEDPYIAFLADIVEPVCIAFTARKYGDMLSIIGRKNGQIANRAEKLDWANSLKSLVNLRKTGTIGDVIELLKHTCKPRLPEAVLRTEQKLAAATREEIDESRTLRQIQKLRSLPYTQLIALAEFINNHTPFATKHGVKGAEFENVLVVFGRGWNNYNWNQFLEWFPNRYPSNKSDSFNRNRNLFYVACSRPKKNLALLFTQELKPAALNTLQDLFGEANVSGFDPVTAAVA